MALIMHLRNLQQQRNLRQERVLHDRLKPLDAYDDYEIRKIYRLTRNFILQLHGLIHIDIEPKTNRSHAVPALIFVLVGLLSGIIC